MLKYKNFANIIDSKNIIIYQFEYFFTNKKTVHIDIVKKKTIKLLTKYHDFVDVFNQKTK